MNISEKIYNIEKERDTVQHDLYIVAGQLQESNVDPIDSWTFFNWLQKHDIPSVYIVKEEDIFYKNTIKGKKTENIIVLPSFNKGYELLEYTSIWARACAFIVEWDLGGTEVDFWIHNLSDCRYVFLQHGIIGTDISDLLLYPCHNIYNDVNVASEKEKKCIEQGLNNNLCFIGGLPRYDLLRDVSPKENNGNKTILVMFTWRYKFATEPELLSSSDYWQGLISLFSKENTERLKTRNIQIVLALHHSLIRKREITNIPPFIKTIEQSDISYWIRHSNALITDFSSVAFDFLFQKKPVIAYIPDKDSNIYDEDSIDRKKIDSASERHILFHSPKDSKEVIDLIEYYNNRDFVLEPKYLEESEKWFDNKENISKHIFEQIERRLLLERLTTIRQEKEQSDIQNRLYKSEIDKSHELIDKYNAQIITYKNNITQYEQDINNKTEKIKKLRQTRKYLIAFLIFLFIILLYLLLL